MNRQVNSELRPSRVNLMGQPPQAEDDGSYLTDRDERLTSGETGAEMCAELAYEALKQRMTSRRGRMVFHRATALCQSYQGFLCETMLLSLAGSFLPDNVCPVLHLGGQFF